MAHFAKLDSNNIVTFVTVGRDEDDENELTARTGDVYKRTSYNTRGGIHYGPDNQPDGGVAFRANYAGIGYYYDATHDVFYWPEQPYPSWTLSAPTWIWAPPTPFPTDGKFYKWDEPTKTWILDTTFE
jgi:hypothetical protein